MSTPYTPAAIRHTTITCIDDDDAVGVAAPNLAFTELADNIEFLRQKTRIGLGSVHVPIEAGRAEDYGAIEWQYTPYLWAQNSVGTRKVVFDLAFATGTQISIVSIICGAGRGGNTHASLPAVMPSIKLVEVDASGAATTIGTQADTRPNIATYDVAHSIDLVLGSPYTTLANNRYLLVVQGESGANSVADSFYVTDVSVAKAGP
jgi:hypothetical protein